MRLASGVADARDILREIVMEEFFSSFTGISAFLVGIMFLAAFLKLWQGQKESKTEKL